MRRDETRREQGRGNGSPNDSHLSFLQPFRPGRPSRGRTNCRDVLVSFQRFLAVCDAFRANHDASRAATTRTRSFTDEGNEARIPFSLRNRRRVPCYPVSLGKGSQSISSSSSYSPSFVSLFLYLPPKFYRLSKISQRRIDVVRQVGGDRAKCKCRRDERRKRGDEEDRDEEEGCVECFEKEKKKRKEGKERKKYARSRADGDG